MGLDFGKNQLFGNNDNIFDESKSVSFSTDSPRTGLAVFAPGFDQDTDVTSYNINAVATKETNLIKGFRTTYEICNGMTTSDYFIYGIINSTKGTVLGAWSSTIPPQGGVSVSRFWTIEQIAPNDVIAFQVAEGVIGTASTSPILGIIKFSVGTIQLKENIYEN